MSAGPLFRCVAGVQHHKRCLHGMQPAARAAGPAEVSPWPPAGGAPAPPRPHRGPRLLAAAAPPSTQSWDDISGQRPPSRAPPGTTLAPPTFGGHGCGQVCGCPFLPAEPLSAGAGRRPGAPADEGLGGAPASLPRLSALVTSTGAPGSDTRSCRCQLRTLAGAHPAPGWLLQPSLQ